MSARTWGRDPFEGVSRLSGGSPAPVHIASSRFPSVGGKQDSHFMSEPIESSFPRRNIASYLDSLSSGTPAPGGGSAAGLAGAMGCALGSMVCNLSLGREHDASIDNLRGTFLALQSSLLDQSIADERVFS